MITFKEYLIEFNQKAPAIRDNVKRIMDEPDERNAEPSTNRRAQRATRRLRARGYDSNNEVNQNRLNPEEEEEDRITQKLDAIKQRLENGEEEKADTGFKRDRKWNVDKQRYSKMARMARNQARNGPLYDENDDGYGNTGLGNPEGMKTGGGSGFSG